MAFFVLSLGTRIFRDCGDRVESDPEQGSFTPLMGWPSLAGSTEISCLRLQAKAAQSSFWLLSRLGSPRAPPPRGQSCGAELAEGPRGHYLLVQVGGQGGKAQLSSQGIISQQRICIHTSFPITSLAQVTRKSWGKEQLGRLLGI